MRWYKSRVQNLLIFVLASILLVACSGPEQAETIIASKIEQMEKAVESRSSRDFLEPVFHGFVSDVGRNKEWLQRTFAFYQLRHQRISVVVSNLEVSIRQSGVAQAEFDVLLTGGEGLLPNSAATYRVETDWRQEQGDWVLVYASWNKP